MTVARLLASCWVLLATACGAGDNRLDPGDLELRDVLGISPETASAWDADQRAAARHVIDDGLHRAGAPAIRASLGKAAVLDRRVANALASVDADRARHATGALGLVHVAIGPSDLLATTRIATLAPHGTAALELRLDEWDREPGWGKLPARGLDVIAAIATDAGHTAGPIVVTPAPRLAVVAAYLPATSTDPARLVINPVVLAALEPAKTASAQSVTTVEHSQANPYSFYGSVAECAAAQRTRCTSCLADSSCVAITNLGDGNAECTQLGATSGRGYFLICINLALAIDSVSSCTAGGAPSCPRDTRASESISTLENNSDFLDNPACGRPLDACLATIFGSPDGPFPGPGDPGTTPPPRDTAIGCGDTNANCDAGCDLSGASCEAEDGSCDNSCADSGDSSGCESTGDGGGGGDCGDSEDACGSSDNSSCDSSDCDSGGESDCGDSGGDCEGGGGDCGDSGDCNAAGKRGRHGGGGSLIFAIMWAFLPVPFAAAVSRRAARRRARAEHDEVSS